VSEGGPCKVDKTELNDGTASWSATCVTPKFTLHQEWVEHYHGETMDGQYTLRSSVPDQPPIERTQLLEGRYLGPCETN
jgi:hypothetical protein